MNRITLRPLQNLRLRGLQRVALGLILSALLSASSSAKEADEQTVNSWYAQTVARGPAGLNVNYFWSLGPKFRAETVVSGHKVVTIVSGDTYYVYNATMMTGTAVRRTAAAIAADSSRVRPFGNEVEVLLSQGAEKIREETLFNIPSEVYQISNEAGRRVIWVTQDSRRLPIRIEIYNRKTGTTSYKEYFDWQIGIPLAEEFFEPEPAAKLKHFEFDEYLEKVASGDVAGFLPILYEDLWIGQASDGDAAGASSPR
jgi:hypothetical protein